MPSVGVAVWCFPMSYHFLLPNYNIAPTFIGCSWIDSLSRVYDLDPSKTSFSQFGIASTSFCHSSKRASSSTHAAEHNTRQPQAR